MALLMLLAKLQNKYAWELRIAHVNYGLRGKDSDRDETLVRSTARKLKLPLSVLHSKTRPNKNIEATLRDIRYRFFEKLRKKHHLDIIVTAHTEDDLAETFLLNLLRGTGKHGLSPLTRQPHTVRPCLSFSKASLVNFLAVTKTFFRLDKTNLDRSFTRNRIRHELLPLLARDYNPKIVAAIARTATLLQKNITPTHLTVWQTKPQVWVFQRSDFTKLSPIGQRAFLSDFFREILTLSPANSFLQEVQKMILSKKSKRQILTTRDLKIECFSATVETTFRSKK